MLAGKLLLDTNILLAALLAPARLSKQIAAQLRDPQREVFFSAVSIWEIAIKASLGRNDFSFQPEDIQGLALATGFIELPISATQSARVARLPWHHRDPFDRMLIAQAQDLPAQLLTTDALLPRYSELVFLTRLTKA